MVRAITYGLFFLAITSPRLRVRSALRCGIHSQVSLPRSINQDSFILHNNKLAIFCCVLCVTEKVRQRVTTPFMSNQFAHVVVRSINTVTK